MFCFQDSHDVPFFCSDILMMFPMLLCVLPLLSPMFPTSSPVNHTHKCHQWNKLVGAPPPHPTWLTKDDLPRHIGQPRKTFVYVASNLKSLSFVFLSLCNLKKRVLPTFFVMCQIGTKPQLLFLSWVF